MMEANVEHIKLSIIMGTFNGEKTISRAIESILNQSFTEFEFIICDDGSTDATYGILEKYAQKDSRIKLIKNEKNLMLAGTLNRCIEVAQGEYIARMDDDDFSHKNRLEKQIQFMREHEEYAIVGTCRNIFDDDGIWATQSGHCGVVSKIDVFIGRSFIHPTVIMQRTALNAVNNYTVSPLTIRGQDHDLWCKLYSNGYIGYNLPDILLDYYESSHSFRRRKYKYRILEFERMRYWRKRFRLPFYYTIFTLKPLLVGLIPSQIMLLIKRFLRFCIAKRN